MIARTLILVASSLGLATCIQAEQPNSPEDLLYAGQLQAAEASLVATLDSADEPTALAAAQLGVVRLLRTIERIAQTNYRYGVGSTGRQQAPFLRLPVPPNDDPEEVTYAALRDVLKSILDDLSGVEKALAAVGGSPVKWEVDLCRLRLDINRDGEVSQGESLGQVYLAMAGPRGRDAEELPLSFVVGLDTADVYWLRGYCHVLAAVAETVLAYDQQRAFDMTAQLAFPRARVEHDYLRWRPDGKGWRRTAYDIADAVALVHLADWPLAEPERLVIARTHLTGMIEMSRLMWDAILEEKDNDHEWIPGPDQQSVLPQGVITNEQVKAWADFLDEAELVLEGKLLVPFWRDPERGVNLRRVFDEPTRFDLVLWVQGSAAAPYLEAGPTSQPETWRRLQRTFRGNFLGFAFWIN